MHTTASDGRLSPADLVARVVAVGLTTISVTDHDTVAGLREVRKHADAANVRLISGIEITAVNDGRDVHILGYFIDEHDRPLASLLETQRTKRIDRLREIAGRLKALGYPVDVDPLLADSALRRGASVGRPKIAQALLMAGHVISIQEAFDRFLATGRPAFVPRLGPAPAAVVDVIHAAGGLASFAHPGVTRQPGLIGPLAEAGLDAIEAYHTDHTPEMQADALDTARRLKLAVSGGSDYHGDDERRPLGGVTLPEAEFEALVRRRR